MDTKCFLGVMRPATGKVHRGCAVRCLSGGAPPALLVRDEQGNGVALLLASLNDQPLDYRLGTGRSRSRSRRRSRTSLWNSHSSCPILAPRAVGWPRNSRVKFAPGTKPKKTPAPKGPAPSSLTSFCAKSVRLLFVRDGHEFESDAVVLRYGCFHAILGTAHLTADNPGIGK